MHTMTSKCLFHNKWQQGWNLVSVVAVGGLAQVSFVEPSCREGLPDSPAVGRGLPDSPGVGRVLSDNFFLDLSLYSHQGSVSIRQPPVHDSAPWGACASHSRSHQIPLGWFSWRPPLRGAYPLLECPFESLPTLHHFFLPLPFQVVRLDPWWKVLPDSPLP